MSNWTRLRTPSSWGLLVTLGCSPAPKPAALATQPAEPKADVCADSIKQALELRSEGRLWSAKRRLQPCGAASQTLAIELAIELGDGRTQSGQPPQNEDLQAVEKMLGGGQCQQALQEAERLYANAVPNATAAVLAGHAAQCLKRPADTQRWYARAIFELELGRQPRGWALAPNIESLTWLDSATLAIKTKKGAAELRDLSGSGQWAWGPPTARQQTPDSADGVSIEFEGDGQLLVVRDEKTKAELWRREVPQLAELHPTRAPGQGLLLRRDQNAFRIIYEYLELRTGRVVRRGGADGVHTREVVSSPFTTWFSFETPDAHERDVFAVVVDDEGRVTRQSAGKGCRPLAAWTTNEFVSDCGDDRALFAVDVRTKARRKLADKPVGHFTRVRTLSQQLTSFSGSGGVFILRGTDVGAETVAMGDLAGVDWSQGVRWSPDLERFAAVGKQNEGERHVFAIWNRAHGLETHWVNYSASWPGQRMGFAVSRSRQKLALGGCPELQLFDLESGAFISAPGPVCAPLLSAVSDTNFVVANTEGKAFEWQPSGAPRVLPNLTFVSGPDRAISAGDWIAVARGDISPLTHLPSQGLLQLPDDGDVRAISPDGEHVVYETSRETAGKVDLELVLAKLESQAPKATERSRWQRSSKAQAVFSRDGKQLFFKVGSNDRPDHWQALELATLTVREAPRGEDLDGAVELSADGSTILKSSSIIPSGGEPIVLPYAGKSTEKLKPRGPSFAARDRLIVAREAGSALLWRTRDARYLGRIEPLAAGGALFTPAPPRDAKDASPDTEFVQLFGSASGSLRCVVGDRLYEWSVCSDRYEAEDLFVRALESASK